MDDEDCPPSLQHLSLIQCMRYADMIGDVGDVRYALVRPVLAKLGAEQLAAIEAARPSIAAETDELWRGLIAKDFADRQLPQPPYRTAYAQFQRDKAEQLGAARERLKRSQQQFESAKKASAVEALTEAPLPVRRRPAWSPSVPYSAPYRSRSMQTVAKQMHSQAHMRPRPPPNLSMAPMAREMPLEQPRKKPKVSVSPTRPTPAPRKVGSAKRQSSVFMPRR